MLEQFYCFSRFIVQQILLRQITHALGGFRTIFAQFCLKQIDGGQFFRFSFFELAQALKEQSQIGMNCGGRSRICAGLLFNQNQSFLVKITRLFQFVFCFIQTGQFAHYSRQLIARRRIFKLAEQLFVKKLGFSKSLLRSVKISQSQGRLRPIHFCGALFFFHFERVFQIILALNRMSFL